MWSSLNSISQSKRSVAEVTDKAEIFDPKHILIKVDVPLAEIQKTTLKQKCSIKVDALDHPLTGWVSHINGEADYQKNTLEVRVAIPDGHPDLRPEMLAQVAFMASDDTSNPKAKLHTAIWIDSRCLMPDNTVFIVNEQSYLQKRRISLGKQRKEGWILVDEGLNVGDRVVLSPSPELSHDMLVSIGEHHE
ncbi:MAG: efflux RND transporter periplasmic adaptor subunit [Planctomycetes bacterium]|nr:efflux RND transporter periplasmic adaptor subunit [Planctomycetota bacterium]